MPDAELGGALFVAEKAVRFGQGAILQIYFESIEPVLSALGASNWPTYLGPREAWRRTGDFESGQREVFVQDPDGYLLMVAENIGRRPLLGAISL